MHIYFSLGIIYIPLGSQQNLPFKVWFANIIKQKNASKNDNNNNNAGLIWICI